MNVFAHSGRSRLRRTMGDGPRFAWFGLRGFAAAAAAGAGGAAVAVVREHDTPCGLLLSRKVEDGCRFRGLVIRDHPRVCGEQSY